MSANYAYGSIGYDTTFELNEFGLPRIRSELETVKDTLLTVLFLKPGQYPSLPNIGLAIDSYLYEHYDELDVEKLKTDIIEQCEALNPYIRNASILVRKLNYLNQPSLIIQVRGRETFPEGYLHDNLNNTDQYNIGITYDDLHHMIYNVNRGGDE